jgi:hypothetical protein
MLYSACKQFSCFIFHISTILASGMASESKLGVTPVVSLHLLPYSRDHSHSISSDGRRYICRGEPAIQTRSVVATSDMRQLGLRTKVGRAMAQAVSRQPLAAETRVRAPVSPCGICGGQSGTETVFSPSY